MDIDDVVPGMTVRFRDYDDLREDYPMYGINPEMKYLCGKYYKVDRVRHYDGDLEDDRMEVFLDPPAIRSSGGRWYISADMLEAMPGDIDESPPDSIDVPDISYLF